MANEDILEIQRSLVNQERARQIAKQNALQRDIRSQIARVSGYNPDNDSNAGFEPKPYPTWVKLPNGNSVIANNEAEHNAILGRKHEPAKSVSVDITNLGQPTALEVKKRGRPKKVELTPLPQNLD